MNLQLFNIAHKNEVVAGESGLKFFVFVFQNQVGLPWYLQSLIYFTVIVVPNTQFFVSTFMMLFGIFLVYRGIYVRYVSKKLQLFRKNALMHFDREIMIKRCS